jgi:hypothetical protein
MGGTDIKGPLCVYAGFLTWGYILPNYPSHDHLRIDTHGFGGIPAFEEPPYIYFSWFDHLFCQDKGMGVHKISTEAINHSEPSHWELFELWRRTKGRPFLRILLEPWSLSCYHGEVARLEYQMLLWNAASKSRFPFHTHNKCSWQMWTIGTGWGPQDS